MSVKNHFVCLLIAVSTLLSTTVFAEEQQEAVAGAEQAEFTTEQVDKQLNYLMAKSYEAGQETIKSSGAMVPYAAGLLPDGEIKTLNLKKEQPMPVDVAVRVLGSAMKTWMDQALAVATVVYYTAEHPAAESPKSRVFMIELKHANGHSITRMVPYLVQPDGTVGFGEVIETDSSR